MNYGITIMKKNFVLLAILLLSSFMPVLAASADKPTITLSIPEAVLAETIKKSLPIQFPEQSATLNGVIAINQIDRIKLAKQKLSAHLVVNGSDMRIKTAIAGHQIALNVGNVQLDFNIAASTRFDAASQTLFIIPQVSEMASDADQKGSEIAALLVSLFNGKEIPIVIDKLQPIITNAGSRQLAINMQVKDIAIEQGALVFSLLPDVKAMASPQ